MVIGLQRTGTNWINELIKKNFVVQPEKSFWKHLTPLGVKNKASIKNFSTNLTLNEQTLYIATSKDFDTWSKSLDRKIVDFNKTHKTSNRKEVYQAWMEWKKSVIDKPNFYYHDYMHWLYNWQDILQEIYLITGWKKTFKFFRNVNNVPVNKNFNKDNY